MSFRHTTYSGQLSVTFLRDGFSSHSSPVAVVKTGLEMGKSSGSYEGQMSTVIPGHFAFLSS